MARIDDIKTLLTAIDAATNAIAARIQKLSDQLANGLSPEDAQAVADSLNAEVTRLQALGSDPNNPVPSA